jgi:TPR repeat protein
MEALSFTRTGAALFCIFCILAATACRRAPSASDAPRDAALAAPSTTPAVSSVPDAGRDACAIEGARGPSLARWSAAQRDALDAAMREGIAIVSADDCRGIRLLRGCHARGRYGYSGMTVHARTITLRTDDELRVNAPLAESTTTDAAPNAIRVQTTVVGQRSTTRDLLSPEELTGECTGATHFITSAEVGVDVTTTNDARPTAPVAAACAAAKADDTTPRPGCASPVEIRISRIAPLGDLITYDKAPQDATAQIGTCPQDMVVSELRCVRAPVDAPYLCAFGDAPDCQRQCERGDVNSCDVLAFMRRHGKGVPQDAAAAAKLYASSCDHDDHIACANLGELEYLGDGVPQDRAKAVRHFDHACRLGDISSCGNLGIAYVNGNGVAADETRGRAILAKACDAGAASACEQLAERLYGGDEGDAGSDDRARSRAMFAELCDVNDGRACFAIARRTYFGFGVARDLAAAAALFEKACRTGADGACIQLGLMYRQADGVARDDARATRLMELACGHGDAEGCFNLGIAYENGKGVAADPVEAVRLYEQACDAKLARACFFLADSVAAGTGTKKDAARATKLYTRACGLGEKEACAKTK